MHKINPSSSFIGQNQLFLDSVTSTNSFAKTLLKVKGLENGFLIWSNFQTSGKGRQEKNWEGDAGKNIYASFILKPFQLDIKHLSYLNFACSLAAYDLISRYIETETVTIKWPNDIMVGKQKIAGMLLENQLGSKFLNSSIFGIGINVNQDTFSDNIPFATSILKQKGEHIRMDRMMEDFCQILEDRLLLLDNMQYPLLHAQYNQCLYAKDELIEFEQGAEIVSGHLIGVNEQGQIEIESGQGLKQFLVGEIKLKVYGLSN